MHLDSHRPSSEFVFVHQHDDAFILGMFTSRIHMGRRWFSAIGRTTTRGAIESTLRQLVVVQEDKPWTVRVFHLDFEVVIICLRLN
jgi:hypothetical protein